MRVWNPGCSTGEETYSLAIVLKECLEGLKFRDDPAIQIFATDIDQEAIDKARQGTFSAGIAADVSPERLQRFFVQEGEGYRIKKEVRDLVVFAPQNILVDPPFTKIDILCCRNLLIYVNVETQKKLLPLMHYALNPGGLLILGTAESIGGFGHLFSPLDEKWKVFQRMEVRERALHRNAGRTCLRARAPRAPAIEKAKEPDMDILYAAQRAAVGRLRPSLRGGHRRGRHHLRQRAHRKVPGAVVGKGQHECLCDGPRGAARGTWRCHPQRRERKTAVTRSGVRVKSNGGWTTINLTVRPLGRAGRPAGHVPGGVRGGRCGAVRGEPPRSCRRQRRRADRRAKLEEELRRTRERLQTTVEEMQAAQEELRSANEELQSNNEELQSTNEELTSSKEELQSLNEEMQTVNAELQIEDRGIVAVQQRHEEPA